MSLWPTLWCSQWADLSGPHEIGRNDGKQYDENCKDRLKPHKNSLTAFPSRLRIDEKAGREKNGTHQQEVEAGRVNEPHAINGGQRANQDVPVAASGAGSRALAAQSALQSIGSRENVGGQYRHRGDEIKELVGVLGEETQDQKKLYQNCGGQKRVRRRSVHVLSSKPFRKRSIAPASKGNFRAKKRPG